MPKYFLLHDPDGGGTDKPEVQMDLDLPYQDVKDVVTNTDIQDIVDNGLPSGADPSINPYREWRNDEWYLPYGTNPALSSNISAVNDIIYYLPILVPHDVVLSDLGIYVATGQAAGSQVNLGLYDTTSGLPDALLGSGVAATTVSTAWATTNALNGTAIGAGTYWLGMQLKTNGLSCRGFTLGLVYNSPLIGPLKGVALAANIFFVEASVFTNGLSNPAFSVGAKQASGGSRNMPGMALSIQ